jgi:hypothetical protein
MSCTKFIENYYLKSVFFVQNLGVLIQGIFAEEAPGSQARRLPSYSVIALPLNA